MQLDDNAIVTEDGKRSDMSNSVTNEERVWYFEDHEIHFVTVGDGNTNILCLSAGTPDYRDLSRGLLISVQNSTHLISFSVMEQ